MFSQHVRRSHCLNCLTVLCRHLNLRFARWTDIVEVGSSAQAEAELAGRAESNLVDVMLALQPRGEGELAPWAELLQMMQMPVPRLPANLLSGGPLSAVDVPHAVPKSRASLPARANLPAPLKSAGREYQEAVGFLPALPARHTFVAADAPTLSVDPESSVNDHSAQRRRTAARRQIELNLYKLHAEAVAHACLPSTSDASQQVDNGGEDCASGTKTVVGVGAALHLSAMNERAARYAGEKCESGLWAHSGLSPQTFLNNQALLAAARSVRAPKRKREEDAAPQQRPRLQDAVQTQHSMKADSDDTAATSSAQRTTPSNPALVLGRSSETAAAASATAPVASAPAPIDAAEESDDDKPLAPPKRPALTIGNKPRPSLTIKRAAPAEGSAVSSTGATTEARPTASPISSSPEQSPVAGTASGEDIPMSHPKLMGQCQKMLEEIKAHQSSWPFLAPGGFAAEQIGRVSYKVCLSLDARSRNSTRRGV